MRTSNLELDLTNALKELQKTPEDWQIVVRSTMVEVGTDYEMRNWMIRTGNAGGDGIDKLPLRVTTILHEHSSAVCSAKSLVRELERLSREARDENP